MHELGGGRYRLAEVVTRRPLGGLYRAHDERLGRDVLVQYDTGTAFPGPLAERLFRVEHPGVARVLDGGEETDVDGRCVSYLVYAVSTWVPATRVPTRQWRGAAATAAAAVTGGTVAPRNTDVLVDPGDDGQVHDRWRVQWLPSPSAVAEIHRAAIPVPRLPRHASSGRRPAARRTFVGTVPAAFRKEVA